MISRIELRRRIKLLHTLPGYSTMEVEAKNGRSLSEWVKFAEQFAIEQGGTLPSPRWLTLHKLSGLQASMARSPEAFAHIPQNRKKTADYWVPVARELAKKNGGQLPPILHIKNELKLSGLVSALTRYPEKFRGIKREFTVRKPEEWIKPAKQLIQKNGGKLPTVGWLRENGYNWLYMALKNHPELYRELGLQPSKKVVWKPFEKARAFVRKLGFRKESDWRKFCKSGNKPHDIPATPGRTYGPKIWLGISDWLGYNSRRKIRL